jgi:hypothetical protein
MEIINVLARMFDKIPKTDELPVGHVANERVDCVRTCIILS